MVGPFKHRATVSFVIDNSGPQTMGCGPVPVLWSWAVSRINHLRLYQLMVTATDDKTVESIPLILNVLYNPVTHSDSPEGSQSCR